MYIFLNFTLKIISENKYRITLDTGEYVALCPDVYHFSFHTTVYPLYPQNYYQAVGLLFSAEIYWYVVSSFAVI